MSQSAPAVRSMEGFGSDEVTSPFSYGSVHDAFLRTDTLEQKLKKKYWKTKQTVIQKFGKDQDQFVVAGDSEIDTKLEQAYHLQSSCTNLLQAVDSYVNQLKCVSSQEAVMGDFLKTWSETEYTNAGEVMMNVGKLQNADSKNRLNLVPSLVRMRNEFLVFRDSAVTDLEISIQQLEKARTEYRAALLWMRDVSEKLQNPDYKDQLIKFREAQMTVKETKRRFEKLKVDLSEKIDMVSASRCNLISRSLPGYQKAMLDYTDKAASGFHQLLVDLRAHHHHQYKVRKLLEEIRDLEAEEMPFEESTLAEDDEFSLLKLPEQQRKGSDGGGVGGEKFTGAESDESLLDLGREGVGSKVGSTNGLDQGTPGHVGAGKGSSSQPPGATGEDEQVRKQNEEGINPYDPFSYEKVTEESKDTSSSRGGIEAELRALQNEVLQPTSGSEFYPSQLKTGTEDSTKPGSITKEESIEDLLKLDDPVDLAEGVAQPDGSLLEPTDKDKSGAREKDALVSEWDSFSSFMPGTREGTHSPLSGWESEFMSMSQPAAPSLPEAMVPEKVESLPVVVAGTPTHLGDMSTNSGTAPANPGSASTPVLAVSADSTDASVKKDDKVEQQDAAKDASSATTPNKSLNVDELLGLGTGSGLGSQPIQPSTANEILSAELKAMGISDSSSASGSHSESTKLPGGLQQQPGLEDIDPAMFQMTSQQPLTGVSPHPGQIMGQPMFRSPLGPAQAPPVFPPGGPVGMLPPRFGLGHPGFSSALMMKGARAPVGHPSAIPDPAKGGKGDKDGPKEKEKTWLNFFAHLDPLSNEKA